MQGYQTQRCSPGDLRKPETQAEARLGVIYGAYRRSGYTPQ